MRRRELLGTVCLCSWLAGCGGDSGEPTDDPGPGTADAPTETGTAARTPTPSETPTPTETRTETATPVRYRPVVTAAALVSGWSDPGDLEERRTGAVSKGRPAVVAFRYRVRVPAGVSRFWEGVTVWGPDGEERARIRREAHREADAAGAHTWEAAVAFDTSDWEPGEYSAEVGIGNLELHRVSEPVSFSFSVEPR